MFNKLIINYYSKKIIVNRNIYCNLYFNLNIKKNLSTITTSKTNTNTIKNKKNANNNNKKENINDDGESLTNELVRNINKRNNSDNLPIVVKPSLLNRIKESFGFQGTYRYSQERMANAGIKLYLCVQKQIEHDQFMKLCNLPDVFSSFALITFMHVWMVCVRLSNEGNSGKFVKKRFIEAMWKDINERIKQLGKTINSKVKSKSIEELNEIFTASLFGYDEGILSDDYVLASSIWRHLLEMRDIDNFNTLTILCEYIRKNVKHFDTINENDLLSNGVVTFININSDNIDHYKQRELLIKLFNK